MTRIAGRKKRLYSRQHEIEEAAGIRFLDFMRGSQRGDWVGYRTAQENLSGRNSEYASIQKELDQIRAKESARDTARKQRVAELRADLLSLLHSQITDGQRIALMVSLELLWSKPSVIAKAEKEAKRVAAAQDPPFVPAVWASRRRGPAPAKKAAGRAGAA